MKKIDWTNLILEMIMIMFGVFLALMLNEWRANKQLEHSLAATEASIIQEIRSNHQQLQNYKMGLMARHNKVQQWAKSIDLSKSLREQNGFPGFPTPGLVDAAWQRANSSVLSNSLNVDLSFKAHYLYLHNNLIVSMSDDFFDLMLNKDSWDRDYTHVTFSIIDALFIETIRQVDQGLETYDQFEVEYMRNAKQSKNDKNT